MTKENNPYYKVAHVQAIENCDYDNKWPKELIDWYRVVYFQDAPVFFDKSVAWECAYSIESEMEKEGDFIEYGICEIHYDTQLLDISIEESLQKIKIFWNKRAKKKLIK